MRSWTLRLLVAALGPLAAASWIACGSSYSAAPPEDDPIFREDPKPKRDSSITVIEGGADTNVPEAGADVATVCDPSTPFQNVIALAGGVNTAADDAFPTLTDDELTLYFQRGPVGGGNPSFFVAQRAKVDVDFGAPALLSELEDGHYNSFPTVTADGQTLYFASDSDLKTAQRGAGGRFGTPTTVGPLATADFENSPSVFGRGEELWFTLSGGDAGVHLRRSVRLTDGGVTAPQPIAELEAPGYEIGVASSRDGLTVYFGSMRDGGMGNSDVWMARRQTKNGPFAFISAPAMLNTTQDETPTWLSPDACRLYFTSSRLGTYDIFVATRPKP